MLKMPFTILLSTVRKYQCLKRKNFDEHFLLNSFILSQNKNLFNIVRCTAGMSRCRLLLGYQMPQSMTQRAWKMHEFILSERVELLFTVFFCFFQISPRTSLIVYTGIAIALALMFRMPQKCVQCHDLWVLQKILLLTCEQTVLNNII